MVRTSQAAGGGDNTAFFDAVSVLTTAGEDFDPVTTPTITFDGMNTVSQPFAVKEHPAIKGVVYDDTDSNGNPTAGLPVAGAVVYLDANGNGVREAGEPTLGWPTAGPAG